ncbi:MAG TPA: hypothetical protein VJ346_10635, partial [Bacteroidales bacterium]|nr:hypothetical protein [Bacteroidales bacterium]
MNRVILNRRKDKVFSVVGLIATFTGLILLMFFIADILIDGLTRLDWNFLTGLPSRRPEKAGIFTAMMGTVWILILTAVISFP